MTVLITILIIIGVLLISAALILFVGNAGIRIITDKEVRVQISVCGIPFTIYPDKKNAPKKPRNLAKCRNPEAVLQKELERQRKEREKIARKKVRAAKRSARRAEKKIGIPKQYCPVPNLKENLEMVLALAKKLFFKTSGKVKIKVNKLHIRVATTDAAHTALLYGVVIQLINYIVTFIESNYSVIAYKDEDVAVEPDYSTSECSANIDIVLSAKVWRAIKIVVEMVDAYDAEKKNTYRKAALRQIEQQKNPPRFNFKNILTRIRKDHSLWKTNLLSRK